MMTFSLRPRSESSAPAILASVNTLVVSWKDAAEIKLSVLSDALVIPRISGSAMAGFAFHYVPSRLLGADAPSNKLNIAARIAFLGGSLGLICSVELNIENLLSIKGLTR